MASKFSLFLVLVSDQSLLHAFSQKKKLAGLEKRFDRMGNYVYA